MKKNLQSLVDAAALAVAAGAMQIFGPTPDTATRNIRAAYRKRRNKKNRAAKASRKRNRK